MFDFFIAHSTLDKVKIADELVVGLENSSAHVWYDKKEILTGDNITREVTKGLEQSFCIIILLTKNFISSRWVYFELGKFSVFQKRRIIPIFYDLTQDDKLEITKMLGNLKYIDASTMSLNNIIEECKSVLNVTKIENDTLTIRSKLKDLQKKLNSYENVSTALVSIKLKEYCCIMDDHPSLIVFCAKQLLASVICDIIQYLKIEQKVEENDWAEQQEIVDTSNLFNQNIKAHINFIYQADNARTTNDYIKLINNSIIGILSWYVYTRYSLQLNSGNIEVAYPTDLRYEDFEDMLEIDKLVLREDLIAEIDTTFEWYKYNIYTHIALRDSNTQKTIGYFALLPITEDTYEEIMSGDFKDKDFSVDNILQYNFPDFYKMYIASVAIHPDYQNTNAFTKLYNAFVDLLVSLAKEREVFISEVIAEASTKQGEKLCKMVGMKKSIRTVFDTDIYSLVLIPPEFRIRNKRGKELLALCQQKYEEYREHFE
ncbi:toll/interleukin-1 receptor domain-containing protein [Desulfosporosinus fructosivorans]